MAAQLGTEPERQRLQAVHALRLLDTPCEERFDRITRLARRAFGAAVAAISLVDAERVWFKSCSGMDVLELPRGETFCDLVIQQDATLVIPDAMADPRYARLPAGAHFYAGRPLVVKGRRVGALCVLDFAPRAFGPDDYATLADLAGLVEAELETVISERATLERLKDGFLGVVSHELRTPLTSIRGALGLLTGGLLGPVPPERQRMLEIATLGAERLARLVDDLLDVERLESGHVTLDLQPCDATSLMEQALATVQVQAAQAGVALELEAVDAALLADPDRVIQVLTNLLNNAVKVSPRGGKVRLRATRVPEGLCFEVRDQGRGIPPDKLELVFDRFQQLDASDAREKGGAGLGLAICRGLVAQHGGRIWAENAPDQGAVFRFVLPG
jgi:signal transduction histidine kinase